MARIVFLAMVIMARASVAPAACSGGSALLDVAVNIAPKCFDACPAMCTSMDKLITEFTTSGKVPTDKICEESAEFDCAFSPAAFLECQKVLALGSSIDLDLPASSSQWSEFKQHCGSKSSSPTSPSRTATTFLRSSATTATPVTAVTLQTAESEESSSSVQSETGPGSMAEGTTTAAPAACKHDNALVEMAIQMAPKCFEVCPALCAIMESQVATMTSSGSVPEKSVVKKHVCAAQDTFGCAVQAAHLADCQPVLSAGSSYGLPQTAAALSRLCGEGANDTQTVGNSAMRLASSTGASAILLTWMMLLQLV